MTIFGRAKKELARLGINKSKRLLLPGTSLASVESLSMPIVQEVVLSADLTCSKCQKRVADVISRMDATTESMVVDVAGKKVTLTCRFVIKGGSKRQVSSIYNNSSHTILRNMLLSSCI